MMKKITDLKGLSVGDKVAISINLKDSKATHVSGVLSGIQVLESGQVGLTVQGLTQWIWLEDNMAVTWVVA